jgi:hypothetical protein
MGQAPTLERRTIIITRTVYEEVKGLCVPHFPLVVYPKKAVGTRRHEQLLFRPCLSASIKRNKWSKEKIQEFLNLVKPGQKVEVIYEVEKGMIHQIGKIDVMIPVSCNE